MTAGEGRPSRLNPYCSPMSATRIRSRTFESQSSKIALDVIANPAADGLIEGRRIQQQ
jgi:hypothetical protein